MQHRARRRMAEMNHPVIIYQMAKVGSRSVEQALERAGCDSVHIHYLFDLEEKMVRHIEQRVPIPDHFWTSGALRRQWTDRPRRIITLVRDPVARFISGCFHSPELLGLDLSTREQAQEEVERLSCRPGAFDYPQRWFSEELQRATGIDAMAHSFDAAQGFARIATDRFEVLVLQTEQLQTLLPGVVSDFVGRPLQAVTTGVRADAMYQTVKQAFYIPSDILDTVYGSPFAAHFYTAAQRERFRQRWSQDRSVPA